MVRCDVTLRSAGRSRLTDLAAVGRRWRALIWATALLLAGAVGTPAGVVFEVTSPYHHIRVIDEGGLRTLSFDGSMETRMSLANPLEGHYEYVDFFHLPWLWNARITNVLVMGLGGGSVQRAYQHYYPQVRIDTVEVDPVVVQVAKDHFGVKESQTLKIQVQDGRMYLRRTRQRYDVILMDAYVKNRYGSCIPYHLVSREFFELARDRLGPNGILAYNVIGTLRGYRASLLGSVYATLKEVFPQVYIFPTPGSYNVVVIATRSEDKATVAVLNQRANALQQAGQQLPTKLRPIISCLRTVPPDMSSQSPVLTDDYAPVDGLIRLGEPEE